MSDQQYLDFRKEKHIPHIRYGMREYGQTTESGAIFLPMPSGIATSDATEWQEENNWGITAGKGLGRAGQLLADGYEQGSGGGSGFINKIKGVRNAISEGVSAAASVSGNFIGSVSPLAKSLARGRTTDLSKEQFFTGIGFRTFSFSHRLVADNSFESEKINHIIKALRLFAAPGVSGAYFTWPGDVWPKFFTGEVQRIKGGKTSVVMPENKWLPAIQRCIIKSVEVNYSSQEPYHQHPDGSPTIVELSLQLEEMVLQTKEVVELRQDHSKKRIVDFMKDPARKKAILSSQDVKRLNEETAVMETQTPNQE